MQKIKYLSIAIFIIFHFNSFGQWTEINNIGEQFIKTLNFLNDDLGYVLMNKDTGNEASLMKTIDGGTNWIELYLPGQSGEIQDIFFYAEGEGVVLIRDLNNDLVPSMIFQTVNDGDSWEDISPMATEKGVGVGQCEFLNQNVGFFTTDKILYSTMDGGAHWTSKEFNEYLLSMDFLDSDHGILGTWDGTFAYKGGILTTSDGGLTWTNTLINENYTSILEVRQINSTVAFAAPVHSWAAIQAGQFYKTIDGGYNWNEIEIPILANGSTLRQIDFIDEMNGVICVGNTMTTKIYHTTNGGQTWIEEGIITSTYDSDLQITFNSGYIGGKTGSFYKRSELSYSKEIPAQEDISIFPNPAKFGQRIKWNSSKIFNNLLIVDQKGLTIHQQDLNQNQGTLPQLNTGVYLVQLLNERFFTTLQLIVE